MKVFVDTAAWIALFNTRDSLHNHAVEVRKILRQQNASMVTTEFVLLEVADALCSHSVRTPAINFIDGLFQLPKLEIIPVSQSLLVEGWSLYKQRPDKEWSLTDCISFVVMKQLGINQAFTSDHHFEQAGFIKLL
jgi:predicted nucleic acid-binding protein